MRVIGLDASEDFVAPARSKLGDPRAQFVAGDASAFSLGSGCCAALPPGRREALRAKLMRNLPRDADGTVALTARARAVRATAPGSYAHSAQRTAVRSLAWVGEFCHRPSIFAFATPVLASWKR